MNKKMSKRQRDLKTKLMAAICMLLVSSIMMVSTTYAWFTLSTAPEVTGITTAVGANGNLEMALLPKDGQLASITSQAGDGNLTSIEAKNVTWGNLVDVSDTSIYGLDKITLYPSALNISADAEGNAAVAVAAMLTTPTYGSDGRVKDLVANTFTGYYDSGDGNFAPNGYYGVRAVGTTSGMTDRQLDYRNARTTASSNAAKAKNIAASSLNTNGSTLASIAIKHGLAKDGEEESYSVTDMKAMRTMVNDLDSALDKIEEAYLQYILAISASKDQTDVTWEAVRSAVNTPGATLESVITAIGGKSVLPDALQTAMGQYEISRDNVNAAMSKIPAGLDTAAEGTTYTWDEISAIMTYLADSSKMKVNGFTVSEVKEDPNKLVNSYTDLGGLTVTLVSGAGVYADIADQCGNYKSQIIIDEVKYGTLGLTNVKATMNTAGIETPYLTAIGVAVGELGAPAGAVEGTMPMSDMFGYVIDMAFRTNAADSNLLLQQEAVDRIYDDQEGSDTMGHGASMTFAASTTDFSNDQVKALMGAIRIVFFDPSDGTIIKYGKLDTANATSGADGWTAYISLYDITATTTVSYVPAGEGQTATHIADDTAEGGYRLATADETATHVAQETTTSTETAVTDDVIMPLPQNTAVALSALIYLDGHMVGNEDVAATAASSMTGTMSLQFSSSATLVPMEYKDLHQGTAIEGNTNGGTPATPAESTPVTP